MGIHETKYETKNGKTRKVKKDALKGAGAAGSNSGAGNKPPAGTPAV